MKQINAICCFIIITAFPETAQRFITEGLFFITGCMECVLVTSIQHQAFNDIVIGILEHFFYDQRTDTDIYRSIGTALCSGWIKHTKRFFVNCREDIFCKNFCPGFSRAFNSLDVRLFMLSVNEYCCESFVLKAIMSSPFLILWLYQIRWATARFVWNFQGTICGLFDPNIFIFLC